ncbi:Mannose-6-phosphate isomerase [Thelohanellus kitauei]|uniref:mannose-6-phosphate isomerase n=1 Tax=Thelohanellus kitauei TaxID=669202 RepID=A0A0C2MY45_THEKT|nr:Mannose-6-phosphate isomerase [Thelohanellus kitauei]
MKHSAIIALKCGTQNYEWGVKGPKSLVAALRRRCDPKFEIKEDISYAELWMGTHPKLESQVRTAQGMVPLSIFLKENQLPGLKYLFKVLSVEKALSIQVHPDKNSAVNLHSKFPNIYQDNNHKPEMAIAISNFKALIGFRPLSEAKELIKDIPSLNNYFNIAQACDERETLKKIVSELVKLDNNALKGIFDEILASQNTDMITETFKTLFEQYKYDIGCLFLFLMNFVELKPGEAIVIGPGVPHCYLKGDIVECMANSDNVIRLGLTGKHKDVNTMLQLTDFTPYNAQHFKPETVVLDCKADTKSTTVQYKSGFDEFDIYKIHVAPRDRQVSIGVKASSIMIVISGASKVQITSKWDEKWKIRKGDVFLIKLDATLLFEDVKEELLVYIAQQN